MSKISDGKLTDFRPLADNPNRHTQRGLRALEDSIQEDGWVAPITVAADGESLDGAARLEVAYDKMGEDAIVIEHDGTKPIVMVRTDVPDAKSEKGRRIIYRANRVGELDLEWDFDVLLADGDTIPAGLWNEFEMEGWIIPDFQPVDESEQPRLDQKKPVICPECGHEFVPS